MPPEASVSSHFHDLESVAFLLFPSSSNYHFSLHISKFARYVQLYCVFNSSILICHCSGVIFPFCILVANMQHFIFHIVIIFPVSFLSLLMTPEASVGSPFHPLDAVVFFISIPLLQLCFGQFPYHSSTS